MSKKVILILVSLVLALSAFGKAAERGMTTPSLQTEPIVPSGHLNSYIPPQKKEQHVQGIQDLKDWSEVNSLPIDNILLAGKHLGVKLDTQNHVMSLIGQKQNLCNNAKLAVEKAPTWLKADIEYRLSTLTTPYQETWATVINNARAPYIDEIIFSIAHLSPTYLMGDYAASTQLIVENAELIYAHDQDLNYVKIVDSGSGDDYWSTTKYLIKDAYGDVFEKELPRDIYYWYIVHPKLTDEIPAYIDPALMESNSSHTNNIVAPPVGKFWRSWLYNHNDDDYETLKYLLSGCEVLNDGSIRGNSAIAKVNYWVEKSLEFTSNSERPHQPVRIYRKHIGRCGEHQDVRLAVGRLALIPTRGILALSTDHVWDEIWDERWIHWDGYEFDHPSCYEHGWGKIFGSVYAERSDGTYTPCTETYSDGTGILNIYVTDTNDEPVDGAFIHLAMQEGTNNYYDSWGITNREGKYSFTVGDERTYFAKAEAGELGNTSWATAATNVADGDEKNVVIKLPGSKPQMNYTEIAIPNNGADVLKLTAEFSAVEDVIMGHPYFDDVTNPTNFNCVADGAVNFFMTDAEHYQHYQNGDPFEAFNITAANGNGDHNFVVPASGDWYAFLDNSLHIINGQKIKGSIKLYSQNTAGSISTVSGTVTNSYDNTPVDGVTIKTGVYETVTDNSGHFTLALYAGSHELQCSHPKYVAALNTIEAENGSPLSLNISLAEKALMPATVSAQSGNITWTEPAVGKTRGAVSYSVYRGHVDEDNSVAAWTELSSSIIYHTYTDSEWSSMEQGTYRYAVTALYPTGGNSGKKHSNNVFKNMFTKLNFTIQTSSSDDPAGAIITAICSDNNPDHIYATETPAGGLTTFNNFWKGTYIINVTLPGFVSYEETQVINGEETLNISLLEKTEKVKNILIVEQTATWDKVSQDKSFTEYEIYIDDMTMPVTTIAENNYDLSAYASGEHEFGIKAIFSTGTSAMASLTFKNGSSITVNMLGYYPLNGNAQNEAADNYHGTVVNELSYSDDAIMGQAVSMDQELGGYIDLGYMEELNNAPQYSFACWVKIENWVAWRKVVSKAGKIGFATGNYSSLFSFMRTSDNTYCHKGGVMATDNWYYIATTYDGTMPDNKSKLKVYINGFPISVSYAGTIPDLTIDLQAPTTIGFPENGSITGLVDEVRIWDRAISAAEVKHLFTKSMPYWGTVSGTVSLQHNGEAIAGATVKAGAYEAITDTEGKYELNLPGLVYDFYCSSEEFGDRVHKNITVLEDEITSLDFEYRIHQGIEEIPRLTILNNCYPNPFNPETTISFQLAKQEHVSLAIYNIKGELISRLIDGTREAGYYAVKWDSRGYQGTTSASGIYFYHLKAGEYSSVKRMMMIK